MTILNCAAAGTLESSDALVTVEPCRSGPPSWKPWSAWM